MNNVKYLDVTFENCESIVIPIDRVVEFTYGDVTQLTSEMYSDGNYYSTDRMTLKIDYHDESELAYNDMDYDQPLEMFTRNPTSNNVEDRPNILGRLLNHQDIVGVWLLDEDEEVLKTIYAPWGEEEYTNTYMTISAENGLIKIEIKE